VPRRRCRHTEDARRQCAGTAPLGDVQQLRPVQRQAWVPPAVHAIDDDLDPVAVDGPIAAALEEGPQEEVPNGLRQTEAVRERLVDRIPLAAVRFDLIKHRLEVAPACQQSRARLADSAQRQGLAQLRQHGLVRGFNCGGLLVAAPRGDRPLRELLQRRGVWIHEELRVVRVAHVERRATEKAHVLAEVGIEPVDDDFGLQRIGLRVGRVHLLEDVLHPLGLRVLKRPGLLDDALTLGWTHVAHQLVAALGAEDSLDSREVAQRVQLRLREVPRQPTDRPRPARRLANSFDLGAVGADVVARVVPRVVDKDAERFIVATGKRFAGQCADVVDAQRPGPLGVAPADLDGAFVFLARTKALLVREAEHRLEHIVERSKSRRLVAYFAACTVEYCAEVAALEVDRHDRLLALAGHLQLGDAPRQLGQQPKRLSHAPAVGLAGHLRVVELHDLLDREATGAFETVGHLGHQHRLDQVVEHVPVRFGGVLAFRDSPQRRAELLPIEFVYRS